MDSFCASWTSFLPKGWKGLFGFSRVWDPPLDPLLVGRAGEGKVGVPALFPEASTRRKEGKEVPCGRKRKVGEKNFKDVHVQIFL